jgi:SNF2 family DNA or RNA helicase
MKWFNLDSITYSGENTPLEREGIWEEYKETKPSLLIATYAMAAEIADRKISWQGIICDEYHKAGLMNHKSNTFKSFKKLRSRFLLLLTGTPIRKGPQNLFAPLHLLNSYVFPSYWKFVYKYCIVTEGIFGKEIESVPKEPLVLKAHLAPYLIRRTKTKVLKDLPPLIRQGLYIPMTKAQETIYNELAKEGILDTPEGMLICPNDAVKLLRLRQILCTPRIFGFDVDGGALEALREQVKESFEEGRSVAICTPFKGGIRAILSRLDLDKDHVYVIHGDLKINPSEVSRAFQNDKCIEKAIVFTITSGMSWDAYSASDIYFMGAEWTATDNAQAESRIHRMGQTLPTNAYYILYPNTIDEGVIEKLNQKTLAANWVLETDYMIDLMEKQRKKYQGR